MKLIKYLMTGILLSSIVSTAHALVIDEFTAWTRSDTGFYGIAISTPNDGIADILESFTFLQSDGSTAVGGGKVYLFDSSYTGTPWALSSASYAAVSDSYASSMYSFASSLPILDPGKLYYVYSDTALNVGYQFSSETTSSTGHQYISSATSSFSSVGNYQGGANFRAEGIPVPEPTALALMGLGLAGIGYQRRRSKKAA